MSVVTFHLMLFGLFRNRGIGLSLKGKNLLSCVFSSISCTSHNCISLLFQRQKKSRAIGAGPVLVSPYGFFDGATANGYGGVGFCLFLSESHSYEFALGASSCTNTKA